MKKIFKSTVAILLLAALIGSAAAFASDQKLSPVKGDETVATVNGEPITMEDMNKVFAAMHTGMGEYKKAGGINFQDALKRLINTRLILLEAENIGLDELPEIKAAVERYSKQALRIFLSKESTKDLAADQEEVDRLYKEGVKEYKIRSIKFGKEKDARKVEKEILAGQDFDMMVKKKISGGIAEINVREEYVKNKDLLPEIAEALLKMKVGSVSPVVKAQNVFVILKLDGIRFPEDPGVREEISKKVLEDKKGKVAVSYEEALEKKYAKIDKKLLDSLDFESKDPGFQEMLKDNRVLAEIEGEDPVTVGTLAEGLEKEFFHGMEKAVEEKKANKKKETVFYGILGKRVLEKEALVSGIDKTRLYKDTVAEYKNSIVFGTFIEKVIVPNIRLDVKEITDYYDKHIQEFSSPEAVRIRSLVFLDKDKAEGALNSLRKGSDYKWVKANTEGQADKETKGLIELDGNLEISDDLAQGLPEVLQGAHPGDARIYQSPEGHYYVIFFDEITPSKPAPLESVAVQIKKEVIDQKILKALEEYADNLRKHYPVKIYKKGF
ncbi:MAG: peptidyl-prolyl cis-trans isomerase [bacterium]